MKCPRERVNSTLSTDWCADRELPHSGALTRNGARYGAPIQAQIADYVIYQGSPIFVVYCMVVMK